jgi:arylsulfatase A-like enzyme
MTQKFKGIENLDIRDSVPDWTPYTQPMAPDGSPNVLMIMWDDVGFAAFESYGGLVKMPNMDRISKKGLRYTQFHTTALCSPTRAAALTGRNHTTVGMAGIGEIATGFPGSSGLIPFNAATLAEGLVEKGYNTYCLGKWHLSPVSEVSMAGSKRTWPLGRGFERYYGFLGGETDQWYPDLVQDNQFIDQPYSVDEGYHLSKDLADRAIGMMADAKQVAPDKPFFMYYAPGAGHAPHNVPKEWADKYKGVFDDGYDVYAQETFERMQKLGNIFPDSTELAPMNSNVDATSVDGEKWPDLDHIRPWDSLNEDEKSLFRRMAEVWAGYLSYTDHHIGRMLDYLEDTGQMDNTMVVVMSDNGASGEGGPNGSVNENLFFNNIPDTIENNMKYLDVLGGPETYNHFPTGWAQAFCTPYKWYKRYNWNGGICDPLIISWPDKIKDHGGVRDQYCHTIDLVPTIYEALGFDEPDNVKNLEQIPIEGISLAYTFDDEKVETQKLTQWYAMLGNRAIYHEGWKATTVHPPLSGWGGFTSDKWELFNVDADRSEMHDLSEAYPEKLQEMINLWFSEAGRYNGLPINDLTAAEQLSGTPRPEIAKPTDRYEYRPNTLEVPEADAVSTRGRSWKFAVEANLDKDADGVLFAQGSRFGGYSMYIKDAKLKFVYNYVGLEEQMLTSDVDLPTGDCVLGVSYDLAEVAKEKHAAFGTATLFINDKQVAQQKIKTQIANFALSGEGFAVGRDAGAPVTPDYNGSHPWSFSGGTIDKVTADVSGEAYVDLEKDMIAAMKRD